MWGKTMLLDGYAGTYADKQNKSLWRFTVDTETGILIKPEPLLEAADSKYVAVQQKFLAVPRKVNGTAGLAVINLAKESPQFAGEYGEEQDCSAYVVGDEEFWYTANYHDGGIRIYKLAPAAPNFPGNKEMITEQTCGASKKNYSGRISTLKLISKIETGRESGCHQIILAGQFLLAFCLLRDQILIYDRTKNWQQVSAIKFSKGTGPRHGIFDHDCKNLFVVSELSNELFVFAAGKKFTITQNFTALPEQDAQDDFLNLISVQPLVKQNKISAAAAAIRLSPDEKFLYVSVRERNVICVFKLKTLADQNVTATKIQEIPCGGEHPRDLVLTPGGKFVLVVNRYPGSIVSLIRNTSTGRIGKPCGYIEIPQAVSVVFREGAHL